MERTREPFGLGNWIALILFLFLGVCVYFAGEQSTDRDEARRAAAPTLTAAQATSAAWDARNNDYLNDERGTENCTPFGC